MAKQKSKLVAKYGQKLNQAVTGHAEDTTDYGVIELPPNVQGVAKLIECKFDTYKKGTNIGEFYFLAMGEVCSPVSVKVSGGDMKIRGLHTMIMEPVCDTTTRAGKTTTQEQHIERILNEMRKLGGDEFTAGATADDLEDLAEALKEAAPYFHFKTTPKTDQQSGEVTGVWHNWQGGKGLEDYVEPVEGEEQDETETVEEEEEEKPKKKGKVAGGKEPPKPPVKTKAKKEEPEEEEDEPVFDDGAGDEDEAEEEDLEDLAKKAKKGDEEAATRLQDLAVEAGYDRDTVEDAEEWADVIDMINTPKTDEETEEEDEEEEEDDDKPKVPKLGDEVEYEITVKDKKTKKSVKKVIECEVKKVNAKKQTVTLVSLEDHETEYENVPFSDLL